MYKNIYRNKNKKPYIVEELSYKDFVDLQKLSALLIKNKTLDTDDKKINWLKVKGFEYTKSNPYLVGYKYDYFGEYKQIDVRGKTKRAMRNESINCELSKLYSKQQPISIEKKKDLINLCNKKVIPEIYHSYYSNLPSLKKTN